MSGDLLAFAIDRNNSYPMEIVEFFLKPDFSAIPPGHNAQIELPRGLKVEDYALQNHDHGQKVLITESENGTQVHWTWDWNAPSLISEMMVRARVDRNAADGYLVGQARLFNPDSEVVYHTALQVKINRLTDLFQYLPEIYHRDDFTNRFLMLFESFTKPVSQQIDHAYTYFDPHLTPSTFLPWLGSWFGLALEEDLPENRKRDLIAKIAPILSQNGTKQALTTFLEMYTGGEVKITEHLDENFELGDDMHLGFQIALGTKNRPHSFDVSLQVPETSLHEGEDEKMRRQRYRRRIEEIIEMYKPAHTTFVLKIDFIQT